MAATEFNFDALASYVTASKDDSFYQLLKQSNMKFGASTSGVTDILSQLHYLISHWRRLNLDGLSKGFEDESLSFSSIRRMPASIFLRYRDGRYVIDPDNQTTSYCELMFVGRLMEKLFTVPKSVFELFRKSNTQAAALHNLEEANVHNYTAFGPVLVRSQLDAHDPRLPGTGVFDLKTRAVAGVRFDAGERLKDSRGYQVKGNLGTWESYEREIHDLARTVMLKYSLQARLGRMDGIFLAYHNLERIFGFQYLSLADMDRILHGQEHPDLGDRELNLSMSLLGEILDRATKAFPEQVRPFSFSANANFSLSGYKCTPEAGSTEDALAGCSSSPSPRTSSIPSRRRAKKPRLTTNSASWRLATVPGAIAVRTGNPR